METLVMIVAYAILVICFFIVLVVVTFIVLMKKDTRTDAEIMQAFREKEFEKMNKTNKETIW